MELRSVIVDECGTIVRYCSDYYDMENEKYLEEYPECHMTVIEIESEVE